MSEYILNTEESTCTGGGTLSQNQTTKKINLSMNGAEKCNHYFDPSGISTILDIVGDADPTSTDVITKSAPAGANCTNTFAYDGTTDNNLHYVGENPCNYVTFNNEVPSTGTKWVIVNTSTGIKGPSDVYDTQPDCQTGYAEYGNPSGFGFAVGGTVRNTCLGNTLYNYINNNCINNDWMPYSFTIAPYANGESTIFYLIVGSINGVTGSEKSAVAPVVYLNSNIGLSGNGTPSDPYIVS